MQVMYVLPATYLLFNPVKLSNTWAAVALTLHIVGYTTFLDSNTQRTQFRKDMAKHNGDGSKVWRSISPHCVSCRFLLLKARGALRVTGYGCLVDLVS